MVANTKKLTKSKRRSVIEPDSEFVLKLVMYLVLGSLWIRIVYGDNVLPLPLGFVIGVWFTRREKFQIDRKIEYAILLMAMFFGFWLMPSINVIR